MLSPEENAIIASEAILVNHPTMNMPTTFSIVDGTAFIIANSQLPNLNQENNTIIDPKELTNTFILKVKLKI
jgi:hypothetical protein